MLVGLLTKFDPERLTFAQRHGFGSIELIVTRDDAFHPATGGGGGGGWMAAADRVRDAIGAAGLRLSCVGGFYQNNLDPGRRDEAERHIRGIIELASRWGVDRVAGFAGRWPMDRALEESMPRFIEVWKPMAAWAGERGVRIAFEHCPMGPHHLPPGGINCVCTPAMWEQIFAEPWADGIGIEWDASHLICMGIDPVQNVNLYGQRILHVHAKDARVERAICDRYGVYHPGAIEHCFPGLGDANWSAIVKALYRAGYDSDLNIEGHHDHVYNNSDGRGLEDTGLLIGLRTLAPLVDGK